MKTERLPEVFLNNKKEMRQTDSGRNTGRIHTKNVR